MLPPSNPPFALDFRALFAAAPAPMLIIAVDAPSFTIVEVNEAYLTATMTASADLIGQPLFEAMPDNPDDPNANGVSNLRASIERAIASKRADRMAVQKYDIAHPDGGFEERWWDPINTPIVDAKGDVVAVIHQVADATERVRAEVALHATETALRVLNEQLEQRVVERTEGLMRAEEALRQSQKMEAVGQLTGGVAHDFNNLLTVIRGSVEMLQRSDLPAERRDRYLRAVGDTTDRAAALTQQLLAFARRQALRPEAFDVGRSLETVASLLRTLVGSRVELQMVIPVEPLFALADRGQFDTAIVNMAANARDAMEGAGRLTVSVGAVSEIPELRSHPPVAGDFVAITVTDNGAGIPANKLERIFEPFYTTKAVGAGTGLGLSQVFGFAKQSGGDLAVRSLPAQGATFTLYLPRVAAAVSGEGEKQPADAAATGAGVCVLLVEDSPQVRDFAADALAALGYDCVVARDGASALRELQTGHGRFHVVFSDVVMPGMSGIELGEHIRILFPDLPVILASGYSHVLAEDGRHGFELLQKPYSIEQLSRVIREAAATPASKRSLG